MGKEILQFNNGKKPERSQFSQQKSVAEWRRGNEYPLSQLRNLGFNGNGDIKGKEILEVGCGGGGLVRLLNEKGAYAVGMDLKPVIENTKEQMPEEIKNNFFAGDFAEEKLPRSLENGRFDYVIFYGVIDPRDQHVNKKVIGNHLDNAVSLVEPLNGEVKIYSAPGEPWKKALMEYNSKRKGHEVIFEFNKTREMEGPLDTPNEVLIIRKENRVNFQA